MNSLFTSLLVAVALAAVASAGCPAEGVWGEWTTGPCPTTCGAKNNATRTRVCTTKCGDCPCVGPDTDVGPCGIALCRFPDPSCQAPYKKCINSNTQTFFCGADHVPLAPACTP